MVKKGIDYSGQVVNHWWLISNRRRNKASGKIIYTLTNQANGQVLDKVQETTIELILSGKTQISKLLCKRLRKKNGKDTFCW